jgi:hypothetical protein
VVVSPSDQEIKNVVRINLACSELVPNPIHIIPEKNTMALCIFQRYHVIECEDGYEVGEPDEQWRECCPDRLKQAMFLPQASDSNSLSVPQSILKRLIRRTRRLADFCCTAVI